MFLKNTILSYPVLLITSTQKSFEALGEIIGKTGKTIARWLKPAPDCYEVLEKLAIKEFSQKKKLTLIFDDTLIRKVHSKFMEGSGRFYDTQWFRRIMGYKVLAAMLTDGSISIPLTSTFLFAKELVPNAKDLKFEWLKKIILHVKNTFSKIDFIVTADGFFTSERFLQWCIEQNVKAEMRMRSNCVVMYKGKKIAIRDIKELRPKGRQKARTIKVTWHDIPLYITAELRINKNGKKTVVFQASTFYAKPIQHVKIYQTRWRIEMMFRTSKQHLGLQGCFSRKMEIQESHVASVFLAYALLQLDRKKTKLPSPEAALKAAKRKKGKVLDAYISRLDRFISDACV